MGSEEEEKSELEPNCCEETELEDLTGVGSATAEKLRRAGITSVKELAGFSRRELESISELSEGKAEEAAKQARNAVFPRVLSAREYLDRRKNLPKLTSGSKNLDSLLSGGLEPGITELIGAYGTGKTQICLQLCLTV
ncbi:MAG: helix-hairpin-helix domain-containing protein, partial [Candidatus Methanomethylicus sp.]|nr:helix-hairpin-helix domain-containing protein [Candidatus Methanomethylicus sp.]